MLASFHSCGTVPVLNDLLNNLHREGAITDVDILFVPTCSSPKTFARSLVP